MNATVYNVYIWDGYGNEVTRSIEQSALKYEYIFETAGTYYVQVYALNLVSENYTSSEPGKATIIVKPSMEKPTLSIVSVNPQEAKAGEEFTVTIETETLPDRAFLLFANEAKEWMLEENCDNSFFAIDVSKATEAKGKYLLSKNIEIHTAGTQENDYKRLFKVVYYVNGT